MSDAVFAFLVNATWQTALIAGLAIPIARRRFTLLASALLACLAAPLLTFAPRGGAAPAGVIAVEPRDTKLIVILWLAGTAFVLIRMAISLLKARQLINASRPFRGRIRVSDLIASPVTIGRTILLPAGITRDRKLLAAAIAHEHAHVRRGDYFVHVALELIALPLWFHPMLILLRRAIAEAREMTCDEQAASRRGRRAYAEGLVRLASIAARTKTVMAVGVASTSIERRVASLLRPESRSPRMLLIVPFLAAVACTRFNAAPAMLRGDWVMDLAKSEVGGRNPYDSFTQTIEQDRARVAVRQKRVVGGRSNVITWTVITDGVTRPVGGMRGANGSAAWRDGKLQLQISGPNGRRETAAAFIRDGRLICEGQSDTTRYHTEFRRVNR
jgi:BlaR1 peptidase M56